MAANGNELCSEKEFIALWNRHGGSATEVAKALDTNVRVIGGRRRRIEERLGIVLSSTHERSPDAGMITSLPRQGIRALANVKGTVIVFSDAHYWPGLVSVAHKALLKLCKELQPTMIVANGDLMDGARLCRQDPVGWDKSSAPTVKEEIETVQERMTEVALAAGRRCQRVRTIGNHDIRLERYLAMNAGEMEGLPATTLEWFIPEWETTWSLMLNGDVRGGETMIKHRQANGIHAAYNNTLKAGRTMVTGHLHRLCVTPWGDYGGRRWGVDGGTLSDVGPEVQAFAYAEDNAVPHCSGFAVLTYDKNGLLLPPELVEVINGTAYFRGKGVT